MKTLHFAGVLSAVVLCGCEPGVGSQTSELDPVKCDAGFVPYNFGRFPNKRTAEALQRVVDSNALIKVALQHTPNTVTISSATCNGNVSWSDLFKDACEGRQECAFQRTDCRGPYSTNLEGDIVVTYACTKTPSETKSLRCSNPLKNCVFLLSCPQTAPALTPEQVLPQTECVPENCHAAARRNADLQCVADLARPTEYSWGYNEVTNRGDMLGISIDSSNVKSVHETVRTFRGTSQLDLDTTGIPYFNYAGSSTYFDRLKERDLPRHRILMAETLYDVKASVYYPVKPGTENKGMKGTVTLWIYDEYKVGQVVEKAFRCVLHSVDMSKYPPGTRVGETSNTYKIDIDERFTVPKDCREGGSTFTEAAGVLFRPRDMNAVDFLNANPRLRGILTASYDMDGQTILVEGFRDEEKLVACGVKPTEFFYNDKARAVDRYAYYSQRAMRLNYIDHPSGPYGQLEKIAEKLGNQAIFVQEANLTTLGVPSIRPKAMEVKVRTVGPPRGFLRVDADWYLSGDRHNYWKETGLKAYPITLETWLVPLDANDNPVAQNLHLSLGTYAVAKANPYGQTISAKYAITEDLRSKFMQAGGTYEAPKAGKKFKFRTCLKIGDDPTTSLLEPPQYTLYINPDDRCRISEAPFLLRADPSIAPLEPLAVDDLAESSPTGAGDSRMAQDQENDQDSTCVRGDGGVELCRTSAAADSEGSGSFGGSVLAMDNNGYAGGGVAHMNKQVELAGFEVLDEEEESAFETPGTKVSFVVSPDWDRIADALDVMIPGPNFEDETYSGGVKGLSIGAEFKVPVRYGVLQGTIVFGISVGAGLAVVFEYTRTPSRPAGCTNMGECDTLYSLMANASMNDAAKNCYDVGGRLADLRTQAESGFLRAQIPTGTRVWIGGQVADEYANQGCRLLWLGDWACRPNHVTSLRWLADDEDFATATGSAALTLDANHIYLPSSGAPTVGSIPTDKPGQRALTLNSNGLIEVRPMSESNASVCKFKNTASVDSHELKATLELVGAAGFSLAFCSPSEDFGVCLEGSFNVLEAKLLPSITYAHHDFKDAAGRKGSQSAVTFSVDWEVQILSGALELKVVLGKWFSFSYTLFAFSGVKLGEGNLAKKEISILKDFQ